MISLTAMRFIAFAEDSAEEEWDGINLILPDMSELVWAGICFFGLWAMLRYVLLPPIVEGRDQRRQMLTAGQDSVSDSESELAQLSAAHEERVSAARAEAARIVDAARSEADAQRAESVALVEGEIAKLRGQAQADIDSARATALAGARGSVAQLAVGAAGKVLGRNVDLASSQSTINSYLDGGGA